MSALCCLEKKSKERQCDMKWFVLIATLVGKIILVTTLAICLWTSPSLGLVLCLFTYGAWKEAGGLETWNIKTMKAFLKNWKEIK
jgi:hypothetical protein